MPQTMDYTALGTMMAKQVRFMARAIKELNVAADASAPASMNLVRIVEILRELDDDLAEVS